MPPFPHDKSARSPPVRHLPQTSCQCLAKSGQGTSPGVVARGHLMKIRLRGRWGPFLPPPSPGHPRQRHPARNMGMLLRAVLTSLAALGTDAMRPLRPPQALAIAPATEPAALAALSLLRQLCETSEFSNLQVRAICGDSKQEAACRQAICGALCCQGRTRDMCTDRFPTLQTYAALTDAGSVQIRKRRMQAALQGVDTLVILRDDIHPALHDVGTGHGQLCEHDQVVLAPPRWSSETICSHARSLTLIDAAASAARSKCPRAQQPITHVASHRSLAWPTQLLYTYSTLARGAEGQGQSSPLT